MPMRGVTSISNCRWCFQFRTTRLPLVMSAPFCARVIDKARVSLPGPDARSSIRRAAGRRFCMTSIPVNGSMARISTHPGLSFGSVTKFRHSYIP